jgi:aerobic carbon-monoxide dehydrogenase medium subunit
MANLFWTTLTFRLAVRMITPFPVLAHAKIDSDVGKVNPMIPRSFEYYSPRTLEEALSLLKKLGSDAKLLSGGQSLIPMMKLRLVSPQYIVDINRIPGLDYITESDGQLRIGALTREHELEASDLVKSKFPILADTAKVIADPLVRSQATVCGNLAHGDPANDHPATMLALGAICLATGQKGQRTIAIEDFFPGLFTTALEPDEILTEIRIPLPPPHSGGAYLKLERKVGDFATAGVAAQVTLDGAGTCQRAGVGLTNVGLTPIKASKAEAFLSGKALDEATIKQASELAASESEPMDDIRGSAEYKRDLVRVLTARALVQARDRAKGGA